jgi:hypothetical protein
LHELFCQSKTHFFEKGNEAPSSALRDAHNLLLFKLQYPGDEQVCPEEENHMPCDNNSTDPMVKDKNKQKNTHSLQSKKVSIT